MPLYFNYFVGNLAQDCFHVKGGKEYELIPESICGFRFGWEKCTLQELTKLMIYFLAYIVRILTSARLLWKNSLKKLCNFTSGTISNDLYVVPSRPF